jgi:hypothetical protein
MSTRTSIKKKKASRKKPSSTAMAVGQYVDDAGSLARRTASGLNQLRRLINIETKFLDTNSSGTASQSGSVEYLSGIAQGLTSETRVGDSLRIQRFAVKFSVSTTLTIADVRVIIFRDLQNRGATPTGSDLLSDSGGAGAALSQRNWDNKRTRFSILSDDLISLSSAAVPNANLTYTSTHNGHIYYKGTTAAVTDAAEGSVFMMVLTDQSATAPSYRFSSRIEFTDD